MHSSYLRCYDNGWGTVRHQYSLRARLAGDAYMYICIALSTLQHVLRPSWGPRNSRRHSQVRTQSSLGGGGPHGCNIRCSKQTFNGKVVGTSTVSTHLSHLEFDSSNCLSVSNGQVRCQSGVSDDRRQRVPVLVGKPLTAVWVSDPVRSNV